MPDRTPPLATYEEAEDRLGRDTLADALEAGTVRRIEHEGETFVLGADVDRVALEHDPHHLAKVVKGEVDEHEGDGPRALAARVPRL